MTPAIGHLRALTPAESPLPTHTQVESTGADHDHSTPERSIPPGDLGVLPSIGRVCVADATTERKRPWLAHAEMKQTLDVEIKGPGCNLPSH